jgi:lipopolysaccharide biosynthesis protein
VIKNYLIFAHYHSEGRVRKDILKFLSKSNKFFTKIIFVSTKIENNQINILLKKFPKKIKVIKRKNIGYDVYSFKIGWKYLFNKFKNDFEKKIYFCKFKYLVCKTR